VDVVAYDTEPPSLGEANNQFASRAYGEVRHTEGAQIFSDLDHVAEALHERALLLVWPNQDPTEDDDPTTDPWELECLQDYYAAGGRTVIYVGERSEAIEGLPGAPVDAGTTASRRFQVLLHAKYSLIEELPIPTMLYCLDDCTIWRRK